MKNLKDEGFKKGGFDIQTCYSFWGRIPKINKYPIIQNSPIVAGITRISTKLEVMPA